MEHRFATVQVTLGFVGAVVGAMVLWPADDRAVDHRGVWQQSLKSAPIIEADDVVAQETVARRSLAGVAVSAKGRIETGVRPTWHRIQGRLTQVAQTMPAIDVPEVGSSAKDRLTVELPADAVVPVSTTTVAALDEPPVRIEGEAAPSTSENPTWLREAVSGPAIGDRPSIAVVMDDLGLNRRGTAALNRLPAPLTLSFLPYAGALSQQTRAARTAGHELLLHVPMEPQGADWPGPNALVSSIGINEMVDRLAGHFNSFQGFVGVNNHMGSLLTTNRERMAVVMAELRQRGLLFLDSRTTAGSVAGSSAKRAGVPFAERDVFLDNKLEIDYVIGQLARAERLARLRGHAVAIGHPHEVTISALKRWLPTLEDRGFTLVPLSAVVAYRACADGRMHLPGPCGRHVSAQHLLSDDS